jgi:two-component system heavy metal sensor histidine kinase CusS
MRAATPATDPIKIQGIAEIQRRTFALTSGIRLVASLVFLGVVTVPTYSMHMGFEVLIYPMLAYAALTTVAFVFRQRDWVKRLFWVIPFLEIGLTFILFRKGILLFPGDASTWAMCCLCIFTLVLALAGLSIPGRLVIVHTVLSTAAVTVLLIMAGLTPWPPLVSAFTFAFVAVATNAVPRMAETALRQDQQAAVALASLAKAREYSQQLEHLQREKDVLLEIIVHDMRSPVGATILSLEYLAQEFRKQPGKADWLEATDDALSTLNSLSSMITQILDSSKLENGNITLHPDLTALRPLLVKTTEEEASRAKARSISLEFDAAAGVKVTVDLRLFQQILTILARYSMRRTPEGGRLLLAATSDHREVRISIHSNGPAIPAAERQTIFDKFPSSSPEQRRSSAWGLGLYFCRQVVEVHQGRLSLEDVAGWPTSFVIYLPLQP